MPIPGSSTNSSLLDPTVMGTDFYPSLCTFLRATKSTAADGQITNVFTAIDAPHTNLPCRLAPMILLRPVSQEKVDADSLRMEDAPFHLTMPVYVSDIDLEWTVQVGVTVYNIIAVDHDGNNLTTRVGVDIMRPFNA